MSASTARVPPAPQLAVHAVRVRLCVRMLYRINEGVLDREEHGASPPLWPLNRNNGADKQGAPR